MILIAIFQRSNMRPDEWSLVDVGHTIRIDHDTWPRRDGDGWPEAPAAIGLVTLTCADDVWRAECIHPGDGKSLSVGGKASSEEVLASLKEAVAKPWLGRKY